jgi:hypothetical protein
MLATLPPVSGATVTGRRVGRALLAAVAAATTATLLAGCGAGFDPPGEKAYQPADGVNADAGQIRVLDALVVAPPDGGDGVVVMSVVNRGTEPDQLVAITSRQGQVETSSPAELIPQKPLLLSADSTPAYTVRNLSARPGAFVDLQITFGNSGVLNLRTVVVAATGYYSSITPAPVPSESPSGTGSPSGSPSSSNESPTATSPSPSTS